MITTALETFAQLFALGNLIFCCTGSRENFFGLVGRQNNNNNPQREGWHI